MSRGDADVALRPPVRDSARQYHAPMPAADAGAHHLASPRHAISPMLSTSTASFPAEVVHSRRFMPHADAMPELPLSSDGRGPSDDAARSLPAR